MATSDKEKQLLYKSVLNLSFNLVLNVIQGSCDKLCKNWVPTIQYGF